VGIARAFNDFDVWLMEPDAHPYRLSRLTTWEEIASIRGDEKQGDEPNKLAQK